LIAYWTGWKNLRGRAEFTRTARGPIRQSRTMNKTSLRESAFRIDFGPLDKQIKLHDYVMRRVVYAPANEVVYYGSEIEYAIKENSAHWGRRVHEGPEWIDL
jgi:hypothetical protein